MINGVEYIVDGTFFFKVLRVFPGKSIGMIIKFYLYVYKFATEKVSN